MLQRALQVHRPRDTNGKEISAVITADWQLTDLLLTYSVADPRAALEALLTIIAEINNA